VRHAQRVSAEIRASPSGLASRPARSRSHGYTGPSNALPTYPVTLPPPERDQPRNAVEAMRSRLPSVVRFVAMIGAVRAVTAAAAARCASAVNASARQTMGAGPRAQAPPDDASETSANSSSRDWCGGSGGDAPVLSMPSFTLLTSSGQSIRTPTDSTAHDRSGSTRHHGR